ncbi:MFS transporter [Acutalibacter intestini]|uniref:MFS transporter n=1 Tax=Acutalibacter intestini TaxID=3093659 RepID=UPI002AC9B968|nr:MFS transporter [Acutalibacter sp. M00204]
MCSACIITHEAHSMSRVSSKSLYAFEAYHATETKYSILSTHAVIMRKTEDGKGWIHSMFSKMFSRRLWNRDFILVLLVCSIASYTNSIFISLLPVYVLDLGGTNALTGMMMTGLTLLGMATRIIVAPLIDRIGRKKLLVIGSGLYALNALAFCFTKDLNVLLPCG